MRIPGFADPVARFLIALDHPAFRWDLEAMLRRRGDPAAARALRENRILDLLILITLFEIGLRPLPVADAPAPQPPAPKGIGPARPFPGWALASRN